MKREDFNSVQELKLMSNDRLFCYQKLLLKQLRHYLEDPMTDKNDIFRTLEVIETINLVIIKRQNARRIKDKI